MLASYARHVVRWVALLSVVALAIAAVVLVTGDDTQMSTGDDTQTFTGDDTQTFTGDDTQSRTLSRLAAEDIVRNFRNQSNRNVRARVRCRAADEGGWLCSYVAGGKTCTAAVSGTRDDPEINLFCGSKGS